MSLRMSINKLAGTRPSRATPLVCRASADSLKFAKSLPGISYPFPNMFDPLEFSKNGSVKEIRRYRESELTHGRVAMLAAVGYIVGERLEGFPAFINFDGHITGPAINQFQQVQQGFWEPLVIAIGLAEAYRVGLGWQNPKDDMFALKDEYIMGDLGFDPLGLKPTDPVALNELQTKELNNGRLAMIAVAGFTAQELVNGKPIVDHISAHGLQSGV